MGRPSSREKHLENFSQFCLLSVLAASPNDLLATHFSREKRVFCVSKTIFKTFSVFSLKFLWLFTIFPISLSIESNPNTSCHTSQSPFLHHSFSNLQEKGIGFLYLTWFYSCFENNFVFVGLSLWIEIYCAYMFLLRLLGIYLSSVFIVCFPVVIYWYTLYFDNIGSLMTHDHSCVRVF